MEEGEGALIFATPKGKGPMSKNAEFKAWVHQIMSLNHLASDKIEQTFRELCAIRIPLSAYAKKEKPIEFTPSNTVVCGYIDTLRE